MYVPLNSTFTDPGVVATENGVDVNDKVKVSIVDASGAAVDAISTDGPGMYTMTYSAINSDGFSAILCRVLRRLLNIETVFASKSVKNSRLSVLM